MFEKFVVTKKFLFIFFMSFLLTGVIRYGCNAFMDSSKYFLSNLVTAAIYFAFLAVLMKPFKRYVSEEEVF